MSLDSPLSPAPWLPPGPGEVRVRPRGARWVLAVVGFIGYTLMALLALIVVYATIESISGEIIRERRLLVTLSLLAGVIAAWRGARISAEARTDGLVIRNRWRHRTLRWDEVSSIDTGFSIPYSTLLLVMWVRYMFSRNEHIDPSDALGAGLLVVRSLTSKRALPIYATLGNPLANERLADFLDALAAHGHDVRPPSTVPDDPAS